MKNEKHIPIAQAAIERRTTIKAILWEAYFGRQIIEIPSGGAFVSIKQNEIALLLQKNGWWHERLRDWARLGFRDTTIYTIHTSHLRLQNDIFHFWNAPDPSELYVPVEAVSGQPKPRKMHGTKALTLPIIEKAIVAVRKDFPRLKSASQMADKLDSNRKKYGLPDSQTRNYSYKTLYDRTREMLRPGNTH